MENIKRILVISRKIPQIQKASIVREQFIVIITIVLIVLTTAGFSRAQAIVGESSVLFPAVLPLEISTIQKTVAIAQQRIAQAQANIHRNDISQALYYLDDAERLAHSIRDNLSTAVVRNLIEVALRHLEYKNAREVLKDLAPIHRALNFIDVSIPTETARRHIDRVRGHLEKNDKRGAERELVLADRSLITLEVELPLLKAEKSILKARVDLEKKDAAQADLALNEAERQMQYLYSGTISPLSRARSDLWQAYLNFYTTGQKDTRHYLNLAKADLQNAANAAGIRDREELTMLSREVAGLEDKLNDRGASVELQLKSLWVRSKALAERAAEYVAAGWQEAETTLSDDNALIEAKLHVAFAETYQVTALEPSRAIVELNKAMSYLKKALQDPLAGDTDKETIKELNRDIQSLEMFPDKHDVIIRDLYESIKNRLSDLTLGLYQDGIMQKLQPWSWRSPDTRIK